MALVTIKIHIINRIISEETPYMLRKLKKDTSIPDKDSKIRAILLTCNPGNKPVRIPVKKPKKEKKIMRGNKTNIFSTSYNAEKPHVFY